jgi:amino acid permease
LGNYNDGGKVSMDQFLTSGFWVTAVYKFPIMYGIVLIILPLCLIKDISKMRFSSMFGVISLIFLIMVIIIQSPWYIMHYWEETYKEDDPSTHLNLWNVGIGFTKDLNFFKGSATLFYAYSCHVGALPVYKTLKNNVQRRIQKVFKRSLLLDAILYSVVGILGYLSMPINTPDLIVERYKLFDSDLIMDIGRIATALTIIMKVPANYNSFRISVLEVFFNTTEISNKQ